MVEFFSSLLVARCLDHDDPRTWYYALMDYGASLARRGVNANRSSAHYSRQNAFSGSDRQIRGTLLRVLSSGGQATTADLHGACAALHPPPTAARLADIVGQLVSEGFLVAAEEGFRIADRAPEVVGDTSLRQMIQL